MDKENVEKNRFTPEELGLKKVVVEGHRYIDVTPFWIDSRESRRIQNMLEGEVPNPKGFKRKELK